MIVASSTSLRILILAIPMGDAFLLCVRGEGVVVDVIVDRCAGLDVHKNTVMAAVRKADGVGGRSEVVREFSTFTADLVRLGEWLAGERVSQVVMEATGVYWRPVWHVLEEHGGYELLLVNAPREELAGSQDRCG